MQRQGTNTGQIGAKTGCKDWGQRGQMLASKAEYKDRPHRKGEKDAKFGTKAGHKMHNG